MISIATDSDLGHLRLLLRRLLPSCFFRDAVVVIGLAQGQHKNRPTQCTRSGYIPLHQLGKKGYIRSIPSLALRSGKFLPWRHRLCWSLTDQHHWTSRSPKVLQDLSCEDISGTCESLLNCNYCTTWIVPLARNSMPRTLFPQSW